MSYEILFNILLVAVGIFILIRSGVYLVRSLVRIAHFLKVSEFTLSFILMAFATTLPEFAIGVNSAFRGEPLISLGNVLGSNILNLSFALGLVALISGKLIISHKPGGPAASSHWFSLFLGIAPLVLMTDLRLSRLEGIILIFLFLVYLARLIHLREVFQKGKSFWFGNDKINHPPYFGIKKFFKDLLVFVIAACFLLFSASIVIRGALVISIKTGIPELLVGIFIVALGTSLPEIVFGLKAAFRRHGELSLGNLFGATVLNSTLILGITALISPIKVRFPIPFLVSAVTMVLVLVLANLFLRTRQAISRKEGLVLLLIYLFFIFIQIIYL